MLLTLARRSSRRNDLGIQSTPYYRLIPGPIAMRPYRHEAVAGAAHPEAGQAMSMISPKNSRDPTEISLLSDFMFLSL